MSYHNETCGCADCGNYGQPYNPGAIHNQSCGCAECGNYPQAPSLVHQPTPEVRRQDWSLSSDVAAKVGSLGAPYVDGTPKLELKLPAADAIGQPFVSPERTTVTLRIDGQDYDGAVLANKPEHDTVWFSPTLFSQTGEKLTLGKVLTAAGFKANDCVLLSTKIVVEVRILNKTS